MRAIVTGGEGFMGSRLAERLLADSWNVLVVDDYSTHAAPRFSKKTLDAKLLQGRVQETSLPKDFWDPDVIFHLAGKVGPVGVIRWKGQIAKDTIDAAYTVGSWAALSGCPLIDVSTSEVYGSPDEDNTEDTPRVFRDFTARSEYAISKLAAENMLVNYEAVDVRIIRPFNVTGPGQRVDGGFVIPRFVRQALKDEMLTVYQPGSQRRSFTHVDDVLDGMMLAFEKGKKNEVYNLGNHDNTRTMLEIADMVKDAVGSGHIGVVDPKSLHGPDFNEAPEKLPNANKAMQQLGFAPFRTIETIISESVAWEKSHG